MEDPLAEEKAENEAKIEEVRNHFWEVASVAKGGLISEIIFYFDDSSSNNCAKSLSSFLL